MNNAYPEPNIDEYLRMRLMPVEGAIPHINGIDMRQHERLTIADRKIEERVHACVSQ
jgi:hypothetical protein